MSCEIKKSNTVEIITIGREILDGRVIDTNSVFLAEELRSIGLTPRHAQRVDDDCIRIVDAFHLAQSRSGIVIVTGGLGPTTDDLTAQAAAQFLGKKLILNAEALTMVTERFKRVGRPMTDIQKKQAMVPENCFVMNNSKGTAPGFGFEHQSSLWFFLPGVPKEMKAIFIEEVLRRIPSDRKQENFRSTTWVTQFTSEGELQQRLSDIDQKFITPFGFEITYRTRFPENHIGLYGNCTSKNLSQAYKVADENITKALGEDVFSKATYPDKIEELENVVVKALKNKSAMLATVESCTGGLVASRITNVSGSSDIFWGTFVSYHNNAKQNMIGVQAKTLEKHGAVSEETAIELCEGGLKLLKASMADEKAIKNYICIATTGIAGPTGGSETKPVGTCYIGIASKLFVTCVEKVSVRSWLSRVENKHYFSQKSLALILKKLSKD